MKKITILVGILFAFFWGSVQMAFANSNDPVGMMQMLANEMITSLKAHKTTLKNNPKLVYSLAYKIVIPHADLDEMSQRVLPPQTWNNASASQRTQFKKEFTDLLVRTYASALGDYTDQNIRFFPVRGGASGKDTVTVNSQIVRSDGPSVAVSYKLHLKGSSWMVYDMAVEGVSLLQSFQEQFRQKLSQGTMDQLLKDLREHNIKKPRRS
ncbi:MAG: mlaC [Gammaproteobacteria bacterium]|jgi:phospholipid transport system substrate-binding protein|nr:mlaC [Gammaproteobacteria bacterium]